MMFPKHRKLRKLVGGEGSRHCEGYDDSDESQQKVRLKKARVRVVRAQRQQPPYYTPDYEKRINEIIYQNKIFYRYQVEPLDPKLEVKIWDIIVRRCKEFPEILNMLGDLELLLTKKLKKKPDSRLLQMKFGHQQARKEIFKRYFLNDLGEWKVDDEMVKRERMKKGLPLTALSKEERKEAWKHLDKEIIKTRMKAKPIN